MPMSKSAGKVVMITGGGSGIGRATALLLGQEAARVGVIASSGHAFVTYPNSSAYAGTKGGLLAFMRGVALDYAADVIRVNCIVPGATDTPLLRNYINSCADPQAEEKRIIASIPMRRLARPEDVAKAVRFLASSDASYITGTWLAVDGGLLAQG